MSKHTTTTAVYQPLVTIDDDNVIKTDWFQSFLWVVDEDGVEVDEGDSRDYVLDARLAAIRAALATDTSDLADLVRPFFAS